MLIREAIKEELLEVLKLTQLLDQTHDIKIDDALKTLEEMQQYPFYKLYVAVSGIEIVGTFSLLICCNLCHGSKKFGIIENVVVTPSLQGNGIGKMMMLEAIEKAKSENCYKLMLSSGILRTDAHRFYEKLGFNQHGLSFKLEV